MFFVQIAGHLGKDPETRFTPNGQKVTSFTIATNQRKGQQDVTIWVRVTVWGDRFDKLISFLKKGSAVIVSGKMNPPQTYTDKEGRAQFSLEMTAEAIEFSPFGTGKTQEGGSAPQTQNQSQPQQNQYSNESQFQQARAPYAGSQAATSHGQGAESGEEDQLPF